MAQPNEVFEWDEEEYNQTWSIRNLFNFCFSMCFALCPILVEHIILEPQDLERKAEVSPNLVLNFSPPHV